MTLDTLRKTWDDDIVDDVEVPVIGDQPPDDLAAAVHGAVEGTILFALDGRKLKWERVEGRRGPDWKLFFVGGMPETPGENGQWRPPYMTREMFEGADASGDGLFGNLPDGWNHELERGDSVFGFYRTD